MVRDLAGEIFVNMVRRAKNMTSPQILMYVETGGKRERMSRRLEEKGDRSPLLAIDCFAGLIGVAVELNLRECQQRKSMVSPSIFLVMR